MVMVMVKTRTRSFVQLIWLLAAVHQYWTRSAAAFSAHTTTIVHLSPFTARRTNLNISLRPSSFLLESWRSVDDKTYAARHVPWRLKLKQRVESWSHKLTTLTKKPRRRPISVAAIAALVYLSTLFTRETSARQSHTYAVQASTRAALATLQGGAHSNSPEALDQHVNFRNFLSNPSTGPKVSSPPPRKNRHNYSPEIVIVKETKKTLKMAMLDLYKYMQGPKADTLLLLLATSLVPPICKQFKTSPILGFLLAGMTMGPNALGLISGIHTTEILAELGIVFFLFEMGIELSVERLRSMKKDVFGLGLSQFLSTALAVFAIGSYIFRIPSNAMVVLGAGVALSSSAFVLQLLKDKNQLATRFGKASFGILLLQDLAVVPLLVVTPLLASAQGASATGTAALGGLAAALGSAVLKGSMALGSITFLGRFVLNPLFQTVAQANSHEAFLGAVILTVLTMSFMTEGLGLSNTLGAFLAGTLLSETKYRYQVEADIAPVRGILLGLFFVTVGFGIDLKLISSNLPLVGSIVGCIIALKTIITTLLSLTFGLSLSTSIQTGLILSQGGEFAFVAFALARNLGIIDPFTCKLGSTCVALTMALTPLLSDVGEKLAKRFEERSDFSHYLGQDRDATEIKDSDDFVVVVGYGTVGKTVCDLLDRKFVKYVGIEVDPNKAIQARNKGLPVFYGDIGRPEVAQAFNVANAKAVISTIADKDDANRVVISLRRQFPDKKIFARAKDADHADRLQRTLDVIAMVPVVPEDSVLLTLPFGGAVLRSLGSAEEEVNAILEAKRKEILSGRGLKEDEQRTVLLQLGIITGDSSLDEMDDDVDSAADTSARYDLSVLVDHTDSEYFEESLSPEEVAAIAAVEEMREKNPMVAEAIETVAGIVDADYQLNDSQ